MTNARIEKARQAEAPFYTPDRLNEAVTALHEAREALSDKNGYRFAVRAAARACILADEARAEALEKKERVSRAAGRCLRECRAILEEAHYLGAERLRGDELASLTARIVPIDRAFEEGRSSEAFDGAEKLKKDLLRFLDAIKESRE
jgi:hypothetical protein